MLRPLIDRPCTHHGTWLHLEEKTYRCTCCGTFGFSKHKPGRLRPSKIYVYRCSARECRRLAKRRLPGLRAGGLRAWSCGHKECTHELTPKDQARRRDLRLLRSRDRIREGRHIREARGAPSGGLRARAPAW